MSELCNNNKTILFILLISDLIILSFSFIISHPLYFSYLIFFSPYIFKLISFLFPLCTTTFILVTASELTQSSAAPFLFKYNSFSVKLQSKDDEICYENLEIYEIFFGSFIMEIKENAPQVFDEMGKKSVVSENSYAEMKEKRLGNFLKILDEFESSCSSIVEEKKKKTEQQSCQKTDIGKHNSESMESYGSSNEIIKIKFHSQRVNSSFDYKENGYNNNNPGSYGSMRKEKEWKRTLACKLFEERHNVDGGDGMDSLWETYENEPKPKNPKKNEDEEDEIDEGQLCCLQAFKLSAGKVNLGMKKPNLVKFSKIVKGIGWLHHVSKNNKKVHNNGDKC